MATPISTSLENWLHVLSNVFTSCSVTYQPQVGEASRLCGVTGLCIYPLHLSWSCLHDTVGGVTRLGRLPYLSVWAPSKPGSNFAKWMFQVGVTHLAGVKFTLQQIRAKFWSGQSVLKLKWKASQVYNPKYLSKHLNCSWMIILWMWQ